MQAQAKWILLGVVATLSVLFFLLLILAIGLGVGLGVSCLC